MAGSQSIQRLWITKTRPRLAAKLHLSASAKCRMNLPLEHSRRRNHYQAYPTRLPIHHQTAIKQYLAAPDNNSAVAEFLSSVGFVQAITGYKFTDRYLLLQALYGGQASEHPHMRLALLGDTLLRYILKDDWFRLNLPTSRIGAIVHHLVTNANLANVARETGLMRHLSHLNPKIKEGTDVHVLGTVVEALLGAIHEDSGKDMEAVRRAMHLMGLKLPEQYTAKSKLYQLELRKARAELDQPDFKEARLELDQPDLQSQPNQSDLHEVKPESRRVQKQEPAKSPSRRERRRLLATPHEPRYDVERSLSKHKDLDEGSLGYRYQITEEQTTSDGDLEALDAAPARLDAMGTDEEICEDHGTEHALLEDANSKQAHPGDQDANQTELETPTTHREIIEPTDAGFTSSSWKELMRESGDSASEPKTTPKRKSAKSPNTDFDRAMRAMMLEESAGSQLVGGSEWPVRHGWFPQHCQITLDVASSKRNNAKEEVAACEPDSPLAASSLGDVAPPENLHMTKEVANREPIGLLATLTFDDVTLSEPDVMEEVANFALDRLPAAPTLDHIALSKESQTTKEVAASELDRLLAAPTLDDIALPKLPQTTKEVAAYEPDRLRLIAAPNEPCELDRLFAAL